MSSSCSKIRDDGVDDDDDDRHFPGRRANGCKWTKLQVPSSTSSSSRPETNQRRQALHVSNPSVPLPQDGCILYDSQFLSSDSDRDGGGEGGEEGGGCRRQVLVQRLLRLLLEESKGDDGDGGGAVRGGRARQEGFDQRRQRRVRRYALVSPAPTGSDRSGSSDATTSAGAPSPVPAAPDVLVRLHDRVRARMVSLSSSDVRPCASPPPPPVSFEYVAVEEHPVDNRLWRNRCGCASRKKNSGNSIHKKKDDRKNANSAASRVVATFESNQVCTRKRESSEGDGDGSNRGGDDDDKRSSSNVVYDCGCVVAQIPFAIRSGGGGGNSNSGNGSSSSEEEAAVVQHYNRPGKRRVHHWSLLTSDHYTDLRLGHGSLLVKWGQFLHEWRTRFVATTTTTTANSGVDTDSNADIDSDRSEASVLVVKFYTLPSADNDDATGVNGGAANSDVAQPEEDIGDNNDDDSDSDGDDFGYVGGSGPIPMRLRLAPSSPPSLEELLTIIVTTSPIKSNPSTEMLERAMDTYLHGGTDFAYRCRKVIVCGM